MPLRIILALLLLPCLGRPNLHAQEFHLFDRNVQVHGWLSQGFVYTDNNNWLTMNTTSGSAAMTDVGLNLSTQVTDNFRVGAQVFDRDLGKLGEWHPSLDWAVADYRFTSRFGVRGGKVKTVLGLFNDTQDQDFLHTFALLPQSVYPIDLRDAAIAHLGGDVYGRSRLPRRLGDISYTAYAGRRNDGLHSGYPYLLTQFGTYLKSIDGLQYGADARWSTPARGLLVGASRMDQDTSGRGTAVNPAGSALPMILAHEFSRADWTNQFYGQYVLHRLEIDSEFRRYVRDQLIFSGTSENDTDARGWYIAGSYQLARRWEVGSYYSRYTITSIFKGVLGQSVPPQTDTSLPLNHIYDKVLTIRFNVNRFCNLKVEGHFMNGFANAPYPDGFYPQENPNGFAPDTNALVLQTGFSF